MSCIGYSCIGYNYKVQFNNDIKDHYAYLLSCFKKVKKDGWRAVQIYFGDKRKTTLRYKYQLTSDEISDLRRYLIDSDLLLVIHSILPLNFCNPPESMKFRWGLDNLIFDILQSIKMGGYGVVLHLGRIKTTKIDITIEEGVRNYIKSLVYVIDKVKSKTNRPFKIIIETNNRQNNTIGGTVEEIAELYHKIPKNYAKYIFFCIDLQHIFSGGYNIRDVAIAKQYFSSFERLVGKNKIKLIHLDDSRSQFNSHIDRHAPLEEGYIFNRTKNGNPHSLEVLLNLFIKKRYNIIIETDCDHKREKRLIEKSVDFLSKKSVDFLSKKSVDFLSKKSVDFLSKKSVDFLSVDFLSKKKSKGGSKLTKEYIIEIFRELQNYYETMGRRANKSYIFKASSYERAIRSLNRLNSSEIKSIDNVKELDGFGKSMQLKIIELLESGKLSFYEEIMKDKTYRAVKIFNRIYGVGPEKAFELVMNNIYTLNNLRKRPQLLTEKQQIGLRYYDQMNERIPRQEIAYFTKYFQKLLDSEFGERIKVHNAGSYYMGRETSGDIDIILAIDSKDERKIMMKHLYLILDSNDNLIHILSSGKNRATCLIIYQYKERERIRQLDLAIIDKEEYPWYILYFGSGRDFSKKIRGIASDKGYRLNEKGLYYKETGKRVDFSPKSEKEIFEFLSIPYIRPESR